ncbi:MAG: hypothetical protein KatS3mg111_1684 [Pirellulaceae bacterium]|nr:MAG: hypothetical protein KatS3mg111_1684 [Pirellulaceae bacterium]
MRTETGPFMTAFDLRGKPMGVLPLTPFQRKEPVMKFAGVARHGLCVMFAMLPDGKSHQMAPLCTFNRQS